MSLMSIIFLICFIIGISISFMSNEKNENSSNRPLALLVASGLNGE